MRWRQRSGWWKQWNPGDVGSWKVREKCVSGGCDEQYQLPPYNPGEEDQKGSPTSGNMECFSLYWMGSPWNSTHLPLLSEKAMAPHSSTHAWKIPWMEEPGGLQSTGLLKVGHNWVTSLSLFTFMHWRRKCNPLQCSCLENPRDGGALWAAVYGVAQSWTWQKWLSSSSSIAWAHGIW